MSEKLTVYTVPREYLNAVWPHVREHLSRAAEYTYGRYTDEDIYGMLATRDDLQLWAVADEQLKCYGAVVTGYTIYPRKMALTMHFCGGYKLELWKDMMLACIRDWAKQTGCTCLELSGRRGWEKIFTDDGLKVRWVVCELPL